MNMPKCTADTMVPGKKKRAGFLSLCVCVFAELFLLVELTSFCVQSELSYSIAAVDAVQKSGKICVLDIDVQGVQSVKKSSLEPLYLFIAPPSMEALESRLRGRGTETEEQMKIRLGNAAKELEYGQAEGNFDKIFVNNNLEECFGDMVQSFKEWYPHLKEA